MEEAGPTEEAAAEVVVGAVAAVEAVVVMAKAARTRIEIKIKTTRTRRQETMATGIRAPDTLIFHQESGPDVASIIETEKMHIFVQSRRLARGRIFLSQEIEKLTSSVKILSCLMTLYTTKNKKYIQ